MTVAQRICLLMRRPFQLDDRELTLSASVGVALYPNDGHDAATLLKHADTAMYHAKTSGRDNAQLYSASLTEEIVQRMALEADLRVALERGEFVLHYQPQIDAASGRVSSVEALIRWIHPTRGLVSPLMFIPQAEANGLIDAIGAWVLRTACRDALPWHASGVRVAANLSPVQFASPGLPELVAQTLHETGLPADALELEVTESALMENTAATRGALQTLRDSGVHIALDDFGTGYSSLAYLTRMPIGRLKVDRSFVAGLFDGGENEAIVRAVLAMARSLGMRVTAEGVETAAQASALLQMQCDCLQGFYFSRPVPAEAVAALLMRHWPIEDAPAATAGSASPLHLVRKRP
jgi:EAL domain-containing protein (putative c-di-GMP-specific phosphodiesterase class I)